MLPPDHEEELHRLTQIFLEENSKINLSALRTEEQCWNGNILDSLAFLDLLPKLSTNQRVKILDMGTGGGFPLLPLAICLPDAQLVGLDSTQKKIDAVQRIIDPMKIRNAQLIAGRAEEIGHHPHYREQFDIVTSRAVAEINVLLEYCSPFVKPGGTIVLWKSLTVEQELEESKQAQVQLYVPFSESYRYTLPGDWGERQLLVFRKGLSPLPKKFPRDVGVPKKDPLK